MKAEGTMKPEERLEYIRRIQLWAKIVCDLGGGKIPITKQKLRIRTKRGL